MQAQEQAVQELAGCAAGWFETATRSDGGLEYTRTRDGAPDWVVDIVRHAVSDSYGRRKRGREWTFHFEMSRELAKATFVGFGSFKQLPERQGVTS